jgi:hypothetical protein
MSYSWQYPLYTVMVFDEWRNGIPVAYFIISSSIEKALKLMLQALKDKAVSINADWEPSSIIVDNAQAELNVLE